MELERKQLPIVVDVQFIQEGSQVVAYCPALELSSYGESIEDAEKAFKEVLELAPDAAELLFPEPVKIELTDVAARTIGEALLAPAPAANQHLRTILRGN